MNALNKRRRAGERSNKSTYTKQKMAKKGLHNIAYEPVTSIYRTANLELKATVISIVSK